MRITPRAMSAIILAGFAMPSPVGAWGVPGCVNLPEYERALGALNGTPGACDMSIEEARRIVAAQGNRPGGIVGRFLGPSPTPAPLPEPQARPSQQSR